MIDAGGNKITRAEQLLRSWAKSRVPALQLAFAAYAWGKRPDKIEAEGLQPKTTVRLFYAHERDALEASAQPFAHLPPHVARVIRLNLNGPSEARIWSQP